MSLGMALYLLLILQAVKSDFYENRSKCDKSVKFGTKLHHTMLNKKKDQDTRNLDSFAAAILTSNSRLEKSKKTHILSTMKGRDTLLLSIYMFSDT